MVTDRHGRSARADNDPRRRPPDGYRVRGNTRFPRVVGDAVSALPERFANEVAQARLRVLDVPPPPMTGADGEMLLAEFDGTILTVYRRPIESRADSRGTLEETLIIAVGQAIARYRGWNTGLDELFGG